MGDPTVMYYCELCGGSVEVEALPTGWDANTSPYVCTTCLPVLALPLTEWQRAQVILWIWDNLSP